MLVEHDESTVKGMRVIHFYRASFWKRLTFLVRALFFGWWVLWTYSAQPYNWHGLPMTAGWSSDWSGSREECLAALHKTPDGLLATCAPAGILLRPLATFLWDKQPPTIKPYAEFDIAPEFKEETR